MTDTPYTPEDLPESETPGSIPAPVADPPPEDDAPGATPPLPLPAG